MTNIANILGITDNGCLHNICVLEYTVHGKDANTGANMVYKGVYALNTDIDIDWQIENFLLTNRNMAPLEDSAKIDYEWINNFNSLQERLFPTTSK